MTNLYGKILGVAWFREDTYAELRARLDDPSELPDTFAEWLQGAEQREQNLKAPGLAIERVYFNADLFLEAVEFLRAKNLGVTAKNLGVFARSWVPMHVKPNLTDYDNPFFRHGAAKRPRRGP